MLVEVQPDVGAHYAPADVGEIAPYDAAMEEDGSGQGGATHVLLGDFRSKYINRLAQSKVWVPLAQRPAKHQTVFIFDWDDTLLCTSWLNEYGHSHWDAGVEAQIASIEAHALKMLTAAMNLGHTVIITNATTGWVERSASIWAPRLLPLLRQVQIISARDGYEGAYPCEVDRWKVEAFLELQRALPQLQVTNLVALGDSEFEMVAAQRMRAQYEHALLKTVKFQAGPSPRVLLKEMELVSRNLAKIATSAKNMRIFLEKRQ